MAYLFQASCIRLKQPAADGPKSAVRFHEVQLYDSWLGITLAYSNTLWGMIKPMYKISWFFYWGEGGSGILVIIHCILKTRWIPCPFSITLCSAHCSRAADEGQVWFEVLLLGNSNEKPAVSGGLGLTKKKKKKKLTVCSYTLSEIVTSREFKAEEAQASQFSLQISNHPRRALWEKLPLVSLLNMISCLYRNSQAHFDSWRWSIKFNYIKMCQWGLACIPDAVCFSVQTDDAVESGDLWGGTVQMHWPLTLCSTESFIVDRWMARLILVEHSGALLPSSGLVGQHSLIDG